MNDTSRLVFFCTSLVLSGCEGSGKARSDMSDTRPSLGDVPADLEDIDEVDGARESIDDVVEVTWPPVPGPGVGTFGAFNALGVSNVQMLELPTGNTTHWVLAFAHFGDAVDIETDGVAHPLLETDADGLERIVIVPVGADGVAGDPLVLVRELGPRLEWFIGCGDRIIATATDNAGDTAWVFDIAASLDEVRITTIDTVVPSPGDYAHARPHCFGGRGFATVDSNVGGRLAVTTANGNVLEATGTFLLDLAQMAVVPELPTWRVSAPGRNGSVLFVDERIDAVGMLVESRIMRVDPRSGTIESASDVVFPHALSIVAEMDDPTTGYALVACGNATADSVDLGGATVPAGTGEAYCAILSSRAPIVLWMPGAVVVGRVRFIDNVLWLASSYRDSFAELPDQPRGMMDAFMLGVDVRSGELVGRATLSLGQVTTADSMWPARGVGRCAGLEGMALQGWGSDPSGDRVIAIALASVNGTSCEQLSLGARQPPFEGSSSPMSELSAVPIAPCGEESQLALLQDRNPYTTERLMARPSPEAPIVAIPAGPYRTGFVTFTQGDCAIERIGR